MMIWLLTLILLASLAALGYRQGGIKVAFSLVGIVIGALLAVPLGNLIKPLLSMVGVKNPLALYLVAPALVFVIFSIIFKVAAAAVHQKVDVYYKYRTGDLRMALWERLNARLGLCLGIVNGVLYMILLGFVIFSISYATVQLASEQGDPSWMRLVNRLGKDMEATGFAKVARAIDNRTAWYDAADVAGLLYNNPLLEARLSRYPAVLGLSESAEFQDIGSDNELAEMRDRREPVKALLGHPKIDAVVKNPDLMKTIWVAVRSDLKDLKAYLRNGISEKYEREVILGRWVFDVNYSMLMIRRAKPNMSTKDAQAIKRWMTAAYERTSFVAMPDRQVLLKELPTNRQPIMTPPPFGPIPVETIKGNWKPAGSDYELEFTSNVSTSANVTSGRILFNYDGSDLAFMKEI